MFMQLIKPDCNAKLKRRHLRQLPSFSELRAHTHIADQTQQYTALKNFSVVCVAILNSGAPSRPYYELNIRFCFVRSVSGAKIENGAGKRVEKKYQKSEERKGIENSGKSEKQKKHLKKHTHKHTDLKKHKKTCE